MRQFIFAAGMAASLLPGVCAADDVARYQAEAMPYVQAALTTPMRELGDKAQNLPAFASLRLGLAMLAGRSGGIKTDEADDAAKLAALDARIEPLVQAYLKAHPEANPAKVQWRVVVNLTPAEHDFFTHYLQVHSADYWIEAGLYGRGENGALAPLGATEDAPSENAATHDTIGYNRAIDFHIVMAAAQCVVAVRRKAGIDYRDSTTLPLTIRLLQHLPRSDIQARVDVDLAATDAHLKYPTGAAACGTDDQFKADVAALKAAS